VRRGRRLSLEELAPYLLEIPDAEVPLSWPAIFGNDHPIEIEIGFAKGLFLLTASAAQPETNFLGIEIARKYQLYTATRLAKRARHNVRLVCGDARPLLHAAVPAGSVQAIHVYFPDPWWKKRHLKRRLFTAEFAAACEHVLRPGGHLHVVTDVADYHQLVRDLVAAATQLVELPAADPGTPAHDLDYLTNFERKFRKEGRAIFRASYSKHFPSS
jgi:tRNA (guanine-N7-)-methyltransferase